MFLQRLFCAIGAMSCAYVLSKVMLSVAMKLESYGKLRFLMNVFVFIHYISSVASLFIGFFMYLQEEHSNGLQARIDELTALQHDYKEKVAFLEEETNQLRHQLSDEQSCTEVRSFELGRKQGYEEGYILGHRSGSEFTMSVLLCPEDQRPSIRFSAYKAAVNYINEKRVAPPEDN